jgi:hypothetical protein
MDSAGSLKRHCSTSHEFMFTFVPNNLGSSNVKKLAMYFISVLSMFKMGSLEKTDPRTQNCLVLIGNMNCSSFDAFEKERII